MIEVNSVSLVQMMVAFFFPFIRLSGVVLFAPALSDNSIPVRMKVLWIFSISMLIALPSSVGSTNFSSHASDLIMTAASEFLIGSMMGFSIKLLWSAIESGADLIGSQIGFGFAQIYDPMMGQSGHPLARLGYFFGVAAFVCLGGIEATVSAASGSFLILPIGSLVNFSMGIKSLIPLFAKSLTYTILMFFPALGATLSTNLCLGIMSRSAPQLNIFSIGFQVAILTGLLSILYGLEFQYLYIPRVFDWGFEAVGFVIESLSAVNKIN